MKVERDGNDFHNLVPVHFSGKIDYQEFKNV